MKKLATIATIALMAVPSTAFATNTSSLQQYGGPGADVQQVVNSDHRIVSQLPVTGFDVFIIVATGLVLLFIGLTLNYFFKEEHQDQ